MFLKCNILDLPSWYTINMSFDIFFGSRAEMRKYILNKIKETVKYI